MEFQLPTDPELDSRRRKGLAVSLGIHLLLVAFVMIQSGFSEKHAQAYYSDRRTGF